MALARQLILIIAAVAAVASLSRRLGRTAPLVLVVAGIGAAFLPGVGEVRIDPDVVLVGILPPLLYATAIRTSLIDFAANARPIALLSVGLVAFTTIGVGVLAWVLLPIPLAAGFALGAVVAPPDAVAATAVARRVGLPRRVVAILEGESLVNDATAIVCLRSAVAALAGGVTALEIGGKFAISAFGGVAVGVVVAIVLGWIRKRTTDIITDTTVSLVCPFVAYLGAEEVHASGVLAVVVTGLLLGHKAPIIQSASSRVLERANWATIQFLLEHSVFFLIGLQSRAIVGDLNESSLSGLRIGVTTLAVLAAVIVLRFVWVFPAVYVPRWISRAIAARDPAPGWQVPTVIGWAGMRGAITIAAVFVLPEDTPHREVLVLIALVVAAGTLLLQGSTLPLLVRRLGLQGPDPAQDLLTEARLYQHAATAGNAALTADLRGDEAPGVVERLRRRSFERADAAWEMLGGSAETPSELYARLRIQMLRAERAEVLRARKEAAAPDDVLRRVLESLDVEESVLTTITRPDSSARTIDLVAHAEHHPPCDHLVEAGGQAIPDPLTPAGCGECLRDGLSWVHLRLCMACGHVGCCDSSVGRHATRHFEMSGHPVMRSFEPGEAWTWCYLDGAIS